MTQKIPEDFFRDFFYSCYTLPKSMKTIFLSAGRSSRMDPLSDKNFLSFQGKPLILKLLENAHKGGLDNFIIVGNQENLDQIEVLKSENSFLSNAVITKQEDLNGMHGGLNVALEFIEDGEPVIVLNGNDFINPQAYKDLVNLGKNHDGALVAKEIDSYFPGGYFEVGSDGRIKSIVEKPEPGTEPSSLINIVAHYFQDAQDLKKALNTAQSNKDDVYEVALDNLFKTKDFQALKYEGFWQAIKFPWHVNEMALQLLVFSHDDKTDFEEIKPKIWVHKTAQISENVVLKGQNIIIDQNARVYENAVIAGPCYLGENTIVGNNCLVRESNIEKNSAIGYNSEIARSYLAPNVSTHMAYVGDSVVDENVNFGALSVTCNLRLDQKNVKVKIKDKLVDSEKQKMGSIVGKGSQIGAGAKVMPGKKLPVDQLVKPNEVFNG